MIRLDDIRIKKCDNDLFMSTLFLLNQEYGIKLNPSKIDIYYEQILNKNEEITLDNILEFFNVKAVVKQEAPSYKIKKAEKAIVKYEDEATEKVQYVVGVGNIVCYNPFGKLLKGKPTEMIVIKFK